MHNMVNKAFSVSNFVFRHLIASVASIAVPVLILLIAYVVLFIIAIFTNSGLGSPITLPLWLIFVVVASTVYTATLLFPSTIIAEIVAHFFGKWQHLLQIPVSASVLFILVYTLSALVRLYPNYAGLRTLHWANYPLITFLVLTVPLGIYWWTMKIVQTGIWYPMILFSRSKKTSKSNVS